MLGWTNGAIRAWSFAVSALSKTSTAFLAAPEWTSLARIPQVSARYVTRRSRVAGSIASTQIVARPVSSAVRFCTPFERTVKLASSMYHRASDSGERRFR